MSNSQRPSVSYLGAPTKIKSKLLTFIAFVVIVLAIIAISLFLFLKKEDSSERDKKIEDIEIPVKTLDISRVLNEDEKITTPEPEIAPVDKTPPPVTQVNDDFSNFNGNPSKPQGFYFSKSTGSMVVAASDNKIVGEEEDFTRPEQQAYKASFLKSNPTFLLAKGTFISCTLKTKLVSTIAGDLSCVIADDVYSANGGVLLIEKGSTVLGSYKSGQLKNGNNRLFVIWNEIRTPHDITIPISSGSTDSLGGAGIEGWVDNHWLERFGSSIMLSAIDDTISALADRLRKNSDNDYSQNTRENTEKMASKVLDTMINIEPTLYRNHGDLIGIFVNKDIDFSSVYKLKRK